MELDIHKNDVEIVREKVNDVRNFYGAFFYDDNPWVDFGYTTGISWGVEIPFVYIRNKGQKAITNFECKIEVIYDENFDSTMISYNTGKFQIERTGPNYTELKYTESVLKAGSAISLPLVELVLVSLNEESTKTNEKGYLDLAFHYVIHCDGRSNPLCFTYYMRFYNVDKYDDHKSALHLFIDEMIHSSHYFGESVLIYIKQFNGYAVDNVSSTKRFVFETNTTINDLTKITDEIVDTSSNK